jgi:F-type H+-transporting ATPase subunit b
VEGRLSRLDADIAAMQREADENAKAEEQRLLAAGEEERRRIVTSAEQEIETAANTARRELKAYVAELAVQLAEKKIRVSKDTDEALVRAFTAQMGKDGN